MVMLGLPAPQASSSKNEKPVSRFVGQRGYSNAFTWGPFSNYNDDLTSAAAIQDQQSGSDIVKVYDVDFAAYAASFDLEKRTVLWERVEASVAMRAYTSEKFAGVKMSQSRVDELRKSPEYLRWLETEFQKKIKA